MSKIDLDPITSGYNLSKINSNFQKVEDELNNKVLYRDSPAGEPNSMSSNLDMNSKSILNASKISSNILELGGVQVVPTNLAVDPYNGTREALRRSYVEAGYNLVDGSFEVGGTIVNANDVLLQELTGKAFSGPAGSVSAGTDPTSGGFVDVSNSTRLTITPQMFGAIGDAVADDSLALNATLDFLRSRIALGQDSVDVEGGGLSYRCTKSVNATLLNSWGWAIKNMKIVSEATGKIGLDTVGSRGGKLIDVVVVGDKTHQPAFGIVAARALVSQFCDNMTLRDVTTEGFFSVAGAFFYGQETTHYDHCRFWNSNKTGRAAIHSGVDVNAIPWEHTQPITGPTSYINNKYTNVDYRYLPEFTATVVGVSQTNPCVVTLVSNPFAVGDNVCTWLIYSIPTLTNRYYTVTAISGNQITLGGADGTGFPAFSGTGFIVPAQDLPTVYLARGEQHHFDTSYVVAYGAPNVQIDHPDANHKLRSIWLDILFEGAASPAHVAFTGVTTSRSVYDFKLSTYNVHSSNSIMQSDGSNNGVVFYGADITAQNVSVPNAVTLFDSPTKFGLLDAKISLINPAQFDVTTFAGAFVGSVSYLNGATIYRDIKIGSSGDGNYTPTVTTQAGALGAFTASGYVNRIGDVVNFSFTVAVSNNGTGGTDVKVTVPFNAKVRSTFAGRETASNGKMLQGFLTAGTNIVVVRDVNNAYPLGTSGTIVMSGSYIAN